MTSTKYLLFTALLILLAGPSFAGEAALASASADCNNNGSNDLTCTGTDCQSQDGPKGGCLCRTAGGGIDAKSCRDVGIYGPDAGLGSLARATWIDSPSRSAMPEVEPSDAGTTDTLTFATRDAE